jgi:hypothetical protein
MAIGGEGCVLRPITMIDFQFKVDYFNFIRLNSENKMNLNLYLYLRFGGEKSHGHQDNF